MRSKGLTRLVFLIVFMIPVAWYLILQLFGSNNFSLQLKADTKECGYFEVVTIVYRSDSVSLAKKNYLDRVKYGADKRSVQMQVRESEFFDCIDQSGTDLVLVSEKGLWGAYELSRDGVDELLTELDILLLQNSYGKGARR